jgi:hypothetical protein
LAIADANYYTARLNRALNPRVITFGGTSVDGTMGDFDWKLYHITFHSPLPGVITYSMSYRPLMVPVPVPVLVPFPSPAEELFPLLEGVIP